jgi:phosphoribosylamine--glycine ligase
VVLPGLQDHKRLLDGDRGPNTGGMGAYLPVSLDSHADATRTIISGTLAALRDCGRPFAGLLYAGLMISAAGPRVVEFNCRFGDPETQALMPLLDLDSSLAELLLGVARDRPLPAATPRLHGACVTTVLAAANYPDTPRSGDPISLPPAEDGVVVFHAGTARDAKGRLVTAGGRVLAVSAVAPTIAEAQRRSLAYAERVEFAGKQMRSDIGWREIARRG